MGGADERDGSGEGPRISRDVRRLLLGLLFMAGLVGSVLAAAFLLGRPPEGGVVAPGVPLLVLAGMALVVGAAVVFYRSFPGP